MKTKIILSSLAFTLGFFVGAVFIMLSSNMQLPIPSGDEQSITNEASEKCSDFQTTLEGGQCLQEFISSLESDLNATYASLQKNSGEEFAELIEQDKENFRAFTLSSCQIRNYENFRGSIMQFTIPLCQLDLYAEYLTVLESL